MGKKSVEDELDGIFDDEEKNRGKHELYLYVNWFKDVVAAAAMTSSGADLDHKEDRKEASKIFKDHVLTNLLEVCKRSWQRVMVQREISDDFEKLEHDKLKLHSWLCVADLMEYLNRFTQAAEKVAKVKRKDVEQTKMVWWSQLFEHIAHDA